MVGPCEHACVKRDRASQSGPRYDICPPHARFAAKPQWDPEYMGSTMMAPVAWITHATWIAAAMLSGVFSIQLARWGKRWAPHNPDPCAATQ